MARSTRATPSAFGAALRKGRADHLRYLLGTFDSPGLREMLEETEAGRELILNTGSLFHALWRVDRRAAGRFDYRSDPDGTRMFRLTVDNQLVEIPNDACASDPNGMRR